MALTVPASHMATAVLFKPLELRQVCLPVRNIQKHVYFHVVKEVDVMYVRRHDVGGTEGELTHFIIISLIWTVSGGMERVAMSII